MAARIAQAWQLYAGRNNAVFWLWHCFDHYVMVLATPEAQSLQVSSYKEVNESVAVAVVGTVT